MRKSPTRLVLDEAWFRAAPEAWSVGRDYTPSQKSERHWYYGDKSVFEVDSPEAPDNPHD